MQGSAGSAGAAPWHVPGYAPVRLLGFGATGEVWLAREEESGEPVALKRLATTVDVGAAAADRLAARDRLRREAAVLAGLDHPHVVRLRRVLGAGEDLVLVLDLAAGGSLAALLGTRGCLSPGEVVTVAVPLAEALAAAHARGLVHGDVTPANVLFSADGRPQLSDLGVARLVGAGEACEQGTPGFADPARDAGPAGDVHGLAATCLAALAGTAPYDAAGRRRPEAAVAGPLGAVLETALHPDPAHRPSAAELAAAVFEAVPAEPVRLLAAPLDAAGELASPVTHRMAPRQVDAAALRGSARERGPRGRSRRRRSRRRWPTWRAGLAGACATGAVLLAAVTGLAWAAADGDQGPARVAASAAGRGGPDGPAPATRPRAGVAPTAAAPAVPRPARPAWASVLAELDDRRARAFATGSGDELAGVYVTGSPALRRDQQRLAQLTGAGVRARGLRLTPTRVQLVRRETGRVVLHVTDRLAPYALVTADGRVVDRRPGRSDEAWRITLARTPAGWRMVDVARLTAPR